MGTVTKLSTDCADDAELEHVLNCCLNRKYVPRLLACVVQLGLWVFEPQSQLPVCLIGLVYIPARDTLLIQMAIVKTC